jgi:hypothetical protein
MPERASLRKRKHVEKTCKAAGKYKIIYNFIAKVIGDEIDLILERRRKAEEITTPGTGNS